MDDLISRKAAIDAVRKCSVKEVTPAFMLVDKAEVMTELMMLSSAQPEQQHGRMFQEIVVEYPSISTYPECEGKPYFSIKYTENGQEFIGYGTYKPEVLSEYLIKYFMPSAQPDVIPLEWINKHLEWLDNCDNDFAQLAKVSIRAMVELWGKDRQVERSR